MAKIQKTMTFNNAMIDMASMTLVEFDKSGDEVGCFSLAEILGQWDGEYGISMTIKAQNDFPANGGEGR